MASRAAACEASGVLSRDEVDAFIAEGFVAVRGEIACDLRPTEQFANSTRLIERSVERDNQGRVVVARIAV